MLAHGVEVDVGRGGGTAADQEHLGIDHIGDERQGATEVVGHGIGRSQRELIALAAGLEHVLGIGGTGELDGLDTRSLALGQIVAHHAGRAGILLQVAMATAAAGTLLIGIQAHVADLAAGTHNARHHVAVDDDATAHTSADGDHHDVLHALGRAEPGLAHSCGVGVVLVLHDRIGAVLLDGNPQLGQVDGNVGLDLGIARGRDGARNGQADTRHKGAWNLGLGDHLVDGLGHRGKARSVNDGRRGHAGLGKQVAILVEQALLNRSAADVNADVVLLRFHGSPPFSFKHCLYGTAPKAKTCQKGTGLFWQVLSGEMQPSGILPVERKGDSVSSPSDAFCSMQQSLRISV